MANVIGPILKAIEKMPGATYSDIASETGLSMAAVQSSIWYHMSKDTNTLWADKSRRPFRYFTIKYRASRSLDITDHVSDEDIVQSPSVNKQVELPTVTSEKQAKLDTINRIQAQLDKVPTQPTLSQSHVSESIDGLAQLIGQRIADVIMTSLRERMELQTGEMVQTVVDGMLNKPEKVASVVRKPRVVLLGPWPSMFAQVKTEFGDVFDLELVSPDDSIHKLTAAAKKAAHVLVMTSKISHRHTESLQSAGINWVSVGGGITAIRDYLTKQYVEMTGE